MDDNNLQIARKEKGFVHKLFLFIPIVGDSLPIILLFLHPLFVFNANWDNQETAELRIKIWAFFPAIVGIIMIAVIIWYFVVWKVKSFSNYAFLGIGFSIIGCLEPWVLLYLLLLAFRAI